MISLFITVLAIMNGSISTQVSVLDYESMNDCNTMKIEMVKSLETQMGKTIKGYSLECK